MECRVLALKSIKMPNTLHFYVFGWDTKALLAGTIHVNATDFTLIKKEKIVNVLKCLAKQDPCYEIDKKFKNRRVRVEQSLFKTAQDDATIVYSTPVNTYDDLPFVLSFKLIEGKLAPSPIEFPV